MRVIDLLHLGNPHVIGTWQVGDVIIDPGPGSTIETLLAGLGDTRPSAILLTHIHLDHAGGTGHLVQRWPEVPVYVHERGAPHMVNPERLFNSARRLYGDDMERLWGEMIPVPEANIEVLTGGERILDGAFEVAYTPGHAYHHVSFLHDGTAFIGDTSGVRIMPVPFTMPASPPPDLDPDAWHESIARIRAWRPQRLAMTHFGSNDEVTEQLDAFEANLDRWSELSRAGDRDAFIAAAQGEIERSSTPEQAAEFLQAAPIEQTWLGWERYWRKRDAG